MKTTFYLDGKYKPKKKIEELFGKAKVKRYVRESQEAFLKDPLVQNDYWTVFGMLTVAVSP